MRRPYYRCMLVYIAAIAIHLVPIGAQFQPSLPQALPAECMEFSTCASGSNADWAQFRTLLQKAIEVEQSSPNSAMQAYFKLMETFALDAGRALECRMGVATVFFRLGRQYMNLGFLQRAANLFQLAMSMFWDASRAPNGMACLQYELWGINWFQDFMDTYLGLASQLRRNDISMLPHPQHWQIPLDYRDSSVRIGVFSLCDYGPESPMHWILARSQRNRQAYCQKHGYGMEWTSSRPQTASQRHPVWGQLAGPLELLETLQPKYDWIMSMDCDSLFMNMDVTLDSVLYRFAGHETPWGTIELDPNVHFLISEDGRGLAGGNWIIRNSPQGIAFLKDVYGNDNPSTNPFLKHDLRDQFSLLWHLVRPGVSIPMPAEMPLQVGSSILPPRSWTDIGYLSGVRLVPQDSLLGSYPHVSCSQPSDSSHRCFSFGPPRDFIVSIPLLGALPPNEAKIILDRFLLESLGNFGPEDLQYESELRRLCQDLDISRCLFASQASA